MIFGIDSFRLI